MGKGGKWPNEGNRKAGGAARRALKGRKTAWSDEYGIKSAMGMDEMDDYIVDDEDKAYAIKVLKQFYKEEPEFMSYLQDEKNWVGLDDDDNEFDMDDVKTWMGSSDCVDCEDDNEDDAVQQAVELIGQAATKVGRRISSSNMSKLEQALKLLSEVIGASDMMQKRHEVMTIELEPEQIFDIKSLLDPIADYYGTSIFVDEVEGKSVSVEVGSEEQLEAIENLFFNDRIDFKAIGGRINPMSNARRALGGSGKDLGFGEA